MNLNSIETIPVVQAIGIRALAVHQWVYQRSGGRIGHRLAGTSNLMLRTTGAKTGIQRTNALTYARDAGRYLVVASAGGADRAPGWYHNVRALPDVEIQIGTRRLRAHADVVLPGHPERARLWALVNANNSNRYDAYQKLTSRPIPIIAITPDAR